MGGGGGGGRIKKPHKTVPNREALASNREAYILSSHFPPKCFVYFRRICVGCHEGNNFQKRRQMVTFTISFYVPYSSIVCGTASPF